MSMNKYQTFLIAFLISIASLFSFSHRHRKYTNNLKLRLSMLNENIPTEIAPCKFFGTGSVLLSQSGEYDHYLIKSAILIYEHNDVKGSLGLILGKPSAFTMGEMAPNIGVFESNTLYTGGSEGSDTAIMLHKYSLGGYSKSIGCGLYIGGLRQARELVESFQAHPKDFKFIFNNVQWAPGLLESEIAQGRWDVCMIPPDILINQDNNNNLWNKARRILNKE